MLNSLKLVLFFCGMDLPFIGIPGQMLPGEGLIVTGSNESVLPWNNCGVVSLETQRHRSPYRGYGLHEDQ